MKHISLNNLGSKHSLIIKLGQFMSYYKKKLSKNSTKIATGKLVPGPFVLASNYAQTLFPKVFSKMYLAVCLSI